MSLRMYNDVGWAEPICEDNAGSCTLISDHQSGGTFPIGSTIVTYTAVDSANNVQTATFAVHVRGK